MFGVSGARQPAVYDARGNKGIYAHDDDRLRLPPTSPAQSRKTGKKNQWAAASTDIARRAPSHRRIGRSATTAAMPVLQQMDLQRKAA